MNSEDETIEQFHRRVDALVREEKERTKGSIFVLKITAAYPKSTGKVRRGV